MRFWGRGEGTAKSRPFSSAESPKDEVGNLHLCMGPYPPLPDYSVRNV